MYNWQSLSLFTYTWLFIRVIESILSQFFWVNLNSGLVSFVMSCRIESSYLIWNPLPTYFAKFFYFIMFHRNWHIFIFTITHTLSLILVHMFYLLSYPIHTFILLLHEVCLFIPPFKNHLYTHVANLVG